MNSTIKYVILFAFFISKFPAYSQTRYLIKDSSGFDFILNVTIDGNVISGFTRENALLDYSSELQYKIIKAVTSLKHPEIIRFNATLTNDSFKGTYDYLFSSYKISGKIKNDTINYSLFSEENELVKSLIGVKHINVANKNYGKLIEEVITKTEAEIYDPKISQSRKWKKFKEKIRDSAPKISDDLELQIGFFALARNLDFSHYYTTKKPTTSFLNRTREPSLIEVDKNIAILRVNNFSSGEDRIKLLIDSIEQRAYSDLIIDLRNNPGGNSAPALPIANILTDRVLISGFFPNRKWKEQYGRLPNKNDIDKFDIMNGDIYQPRSEYGYCIATKGNERKFKGNVYILVNGKTGSTAEALVIGAKEYNLAKVVGQRTAGSLLMMKGFSIDDDIVLCVPTADFVSFNGYRVDKKGINPDIKTRKGAELEYLIDLIKKK